MLHELIADRAVVRPGVERGHPRHLLGRHEGGDHQRLLRAEAVEERRVAHAEFPRDVRDRHASAAIEEAPARGDDDLLVRDFLRSSHGDSPERA